MRVTQHCDYALRVLMQLALHPERRLTVSSVARAYGISRHHLTKVVHELQKANFIDTIRGQSGGITLARDATDINVGDVVRVMETDLALVECFREDNQCVITPYCGLRHLFDSALADFLARLDQYTLSDIVEPNRHQLISVLEVPESE